MNKEKLEYFKEKLLREKGVLEEELRTVAKVNPANPDDWEAKEAPIQFDKADRNEVADRVEGFGTNVSILHNLEIKYAEIKNALEKMDLGTYGICEVCEKEIEIERLEANLGATTCIQHMAR